MSANRQPEPNCHADQTRMPARGAQPVPDGHVPDGHVPDGHVADGHVPDGHVADGHCPERADEQAALMRAADAAAKLAITRWQHTSLGSHLDLNRPHHESARARWYAHVRQGLQDWIERGGFSQPDGMYDIPKHGATPARTHQAPNDRPCGGRLCDNMQCNNACVD